MKRHSNKSLDKFTQKWLGELPLDNPPTDFTQRIMDRVSGLPLPAKQAYSPLISNTAWMVLSTLLIVSIIAAYVFDLQPLGIFEEVNIWNSALGFGEISLLPNMDWSNPLVYASVVFGLLALLQFRLLRPVIESKNLA